VGVKPSTNRNMVFTGNTFGADIKPGWAPLYGWSNGNLWRQSKWRVGFSSQSADNGKYWWPAGTRSSQDYSG
jgi:hypothetical protein